jgi:hypothetical protein
LLISHRTCGGGGDDNGHYPPIDPYGNDYGGVTYNDDDNGPCGCENHSDSYDNTHPDDDPSLYDPEPYSNPPTSLVKSTRGLLLMGGRN